jgi:hypothetical protein
MRASPISRTSPKEYRKPNRNTQMLWSTVPDVMADYERMRVRQLFYHLLSRSCIEKTERAYKRVADASVQMCLSGALPYYKIVDGHLGMR